MTAKRLPPRELSRSEHGVVAAIPLTSDEREGLNCSIDRDADRLVAAALRGRGKKLSPRKLSQLEGSVLWAVWLGGVAVGVLIAIALGAWRAFG